MRSLILAIMHVSFKEIITMKICKFKKLSNKAKIIAIAQLKVAYSSFIIIQNFKKFAQDNNLEFYSNGILIVKL